MGLFGGSYAVPNFFHCVNYFDRDGGLFGFVFTRKKIFLIGQTCYNEQVTMNNYG